MISGTNGFCLSLPEIFLFVFADAILTLYHIYDPCMEGSINYLKSVYFEQAKGEKMPLLRIDPDHSVAGFQVRHMMISNVRGQFNSIRGTIAFDPEDITSSTVEVEIDASGIHTGISKRDEHLKSPDFLDVENHPQIIFRSTRVEPSGTRRFIIFGELTIRGVTRTVSLETEYVGPVKDPFDQGASYGFSTATEIDREEFGMTWNVGMEGGGFVVGKNVLINLELEADLVQ